MSHQINRNSFHNGSTRLSQSHQLLEGNADQASSQQLLSGTQQYDGAGQLLPSNIHYQQNNSQPFQTLPSLARSIRIEMASRWSIRID